MAALEAIKFGRLRRPEADAGKGVEVLPRVGLPLDTYTSGDIGKSVFAVSGARVQTAPKSARGAIIATVPIEVSIVVIVVKTLQSHAVNEFDVFSNLPTKVIKSGHQETRYLVVVVRALRSGPYQIRGSGRRLVLLFRQRTTHGLDLST